ncbi:MAG: class I SAM-dependent methyltransferase [Patescibacteria group bacterium]
MERIILTTKLSKGYELLDSGLEEKLERFGDVVLSRPDPQALWKKELPIETWQEADALYVRATGDRSLPAGRQGKWKTTKDLRKEWPIEIGGLTMLIRPTSFKHTGVFPEQAPNWEWLRATIEKARKEGREKIEVLNLFGYTGGATIAAAQAGAEVCHVDASKTAVAWAKENAALSGVENKPIRWIIEDVLTFVEREIKRGHHYDIILMDPPAFGHGPKDELWKFEEHFLELMRLCEALLSEKPLGVLINGYAAGYSASAFAYNLEPLVRTFGGTLEYGELTIEDSAAKKLLPCGIFARWTRA